MTKARGSTRPRFLALVDRHPESRGLYKPDHPRTIDRYIDYFADPGHAALDACGELLLDALAADADPRARAARAS